MAPLDRRDRELLEGYKSSLAPDRDVVRDHWDAIVVRAEHEPLPLPRGWVVRIGGAVAAALVVGSLAGFHASERCDDVEEQRVQGLDRAAPRGDAAPATDRRHAGVAKRGGTEAAASGDVEGKGMQGESAGAGVEWGVTRVAVGVDPVDATIGTEPGKAATGAAMEGGAAMSGSESRSPTSATATPRARSEARAVRVTADAFPPDPAPALGVASGDGELREECRP